MSSEHELPDGFDGTVRLFPLPNLVLFPHGRVRVLVFLGFFVTVIVLPALIVVTLPPPIRRTPSLLSLVIVPLLVTAVPTARPTSSPISSSKRYAVVIPAPAPEMVPLLVTLDDAVPMVMPASGGASKPS